MGGGGEEEIVYHTGVRKDDRIQELVRGRDRIGLIIIYMYTNLEKPRTDFPLPLLTAFLSRC